jgi:hypothetical protein
LVKHFAISAFSLHKHTSLEKLQQKLFFLISTVINNNRFPAITLQQSLSNNHFTAITLQQSLSSNHFSAITFQESLSFLLYLPTVPKLGC